jgi:hypothetical protein
MDLMKKILILIFACVFLFGNFEAKIVKSCPEPYSQCNLGKDGMINVHISPHTHDDVG